MFLKFTLTNITTAEQVDAYIDPNEVISWTAWHVPAEGTQGVHRSLRDKSLVTLNLRPGATHWTEEGFHSVSARILLARGERDAAAVEQAQHNTERANTSPMAV